MDETPIKLSEIVKVGARFGRSVNLERDFYDLVSLDGYVLTSTARAVLRRLADAFHDSTAPRAWTLTGPYGSGKSTFALFATKALNPGAEADTSAARDLVKARDGELWRTLFDRRRRSAIGVSGLCPVLVSGSREPIARALLRGLERAAELFWETKPPLLLGEVRSLIAACDAGEPVHGRRVVELFGEMAEKVAGSRKDGAGLLVVIDELGKLLEYAATNPRESDIFVLQELAEATRRKPIFLLTILHQAFDRYVERLGHAQRDEWMKVQGRFEDVVFQEPADQILKIISEAIKYEGPTDRVEALVKHGKRLAAKSAELHLTQDTARENGESGSVAKCLPLHPTVALILGPLFRRVGQNERSLFAFLTSHEPFGFREFLDTSDWEGPQPRLLRLDRLYDYIVTALGSALYAQADGKKWAEIEAGLNRLADPSELEVRLVKAVGLLRVVGDMGLFKSSLRVLQFAFEGEGVKAADVERALGNLQERSVVIYRRYNDTFGLWEGSDIEIESRLEEARSHIDPNESLARGLTRYFKPRPLVARRHSAQKGTLRYFDVRYVDARGFSDAAREPLVDADGRVLYAIGASEEEISSLIEAAGSPEMAGLRQVIAAVPTETAGLKEAVFEVACLRWVKENTPELEGDRAARNEIQGRLATAEARVEKAVLSFTGSDGRMHAGASCSWFRAGREVLMASERALQEYLSDVCDEVFSDTPVLHNELLNRRHLSSSAASARRELLNAMLRSGSEPLLSIGGYPPHLSMYFSVLSETGIHREVDGRLGFHAPAPEADKGVRAVWDAVDAFLAETEVERSTVAELFKLLGRPPFGMKSGPLPVLLCAALLHYDTEVALYENGSFVPSLSAAVLERLVKSPETFEVQRCRVAGVRALVFQKFADVLLQKPDGFDPRALNLLTVVRPLTRFVSGLPDYTKKTQRLSAPTQRVRNALFTAREPDTLLFRQLPEACGLPPFGAEESAGDGREVDDFFKTLRSSLAELQRAYDDLLGEVERMLISAFSLKGTGAEARDELKGRALPLYDITVDTKLRSFIIRATAEGLDLAGWVESIATHLANKPPDKWADADFARFEIGLAEVARSFRHIEFLSWEMSKRGVTPQHAGGEVLRLGVTPLNEPEKQRMVTIGREERLLVERAEASVEKTLDKLGINGNIELRLAVLAKLSKKLIGKLEESEEAVLNRAPGAATHDIRPVKEAS